MKLTAENIAKIANNPLFENCVAEVVIKNGYDKITAGRCRAVLRSVRSRLRKGQISEEEFRMSTTLNACGTAGCIGGWAAFILDQKMFRDRPKPGSRTFPNWRSDFNSRVSTLMLILENAVPAAHRLFYLFHNHSRGLRDPTRKQGIRAIDHALAGKYPWHIRDSDDRIRIKAGTKLDA